MDTVPCRGVLIQHFAHQSSQRPWAVGLLQITRFSVGEPGFCARQIFRVLNGAYLLPRSRQIHLFSKCEGHRARDKPAGDHHAFPYQPGGQHKMSRRAKWNQQCH